MRVVPYRLDVLAVRLLLNAHPRWDLVHDGAAIRRYLRFNSFAEASGFMNAVAIVADKLDHHPEWMSVYDRVEIKLTTHNVHGLSARDAELADRLTTSPCCSPPQDSNDRSVARN